MKNRRNLKKVKSFQWLEAIVNLHPHELILEIQSIILSLLKLVCYCFFFRSFGIFLKTLNIRIKKIIRINNINKIPNSSDITEIT